jgi:ribA/ribD-fused uncharacterized protein
METIKFYKINDEYGYFSNFAPYPIFIDGFMWLTVEHYFQANKFDNFEIRDRIRLLKSPMMAAKEGRSKKNPLRDDWEQTKDELMKKALLFKFLQHHQLKIELLNTRDAVLIEHTSNDKYWADGGDGSGSNRLGQLLMNVREEIRQICDNPHIYLPPWIPFPDIDKMDMFWRMGIGETYLDEWFEHYIKLSDQKVYQEMFPEPIEWIGFYD